MADDTAGSPMSGLKWTRKSTYAVSDQLKSRGYPACPNTAGRLLKETEYSLKSNRKTIAQTRHPDRNRQFEIIAQTKERFVKWCQPIISVDTKKRELVGNFKNPGRTWRVEPEMVYDHDFRSLAIGIAIPYGIYEPITNRATVVVGVTHDTGQFAVESIVSWMNNSGFEDYPQMEKLLILCDAGGSNSYKNRAWKHAIYERISRVFGVRVTVCHYPTGASKWNPVDHRLFSFISTNWAGEPLRSYQTILNSIGSTTTRQGLKVDVMLDERDYETGIKITDDQFDEINIERHTELPQWNYTISS